jgi:hypothetical protein
MMEYEKTATELIEKLEAKHESEVKELEAKSREELGSKVRFSKQVLELEVKEK